MGPTSCRSTPRCTRRPSRRPLAATEAAITLKIEHTTNRVLQLPTFAAANNTITAPTGQSFTPLDLGKSVSGPGIPAGDYIDVAPGANSTTAHMAAPAEGTCTTGGVAKALVEIGAVTYVGGVAQSGTPGDPLNVELANDSIGGTGFTSQRRGRQAHDERGHTGRDRWVHHQLRRTQRHRPRECHRRAHDHRDHRAGRPHHDGDVEHCDHDAYHVLPDGSDGHHQLDPPTDGRDRRF